MSQYVYLKFKFEYTFLFINNQKFKQFVKQFLNNLLGKETKIKESTARTG